MNMMLMNATPGPASMEEPVSTSLTASPAPALLEHMVSLYHVFVTSLDAHSDSNWFSAL